MTGSLSKRDEKMKLQKEGKSTITKKDKKPSTRSRKRNKTQANNRKLGKYYSIGLLQLTC